MKIEGRTTLEDHVVKVVNHRIMRRLNPAIDKRHLVEQLNEKDNKKNDVAKEKEKEKPKEKEKGKEKGIESVPTKSDLPPLVVAVAKELSVIALPPSDFKLASTAVSQLLCYSTFECLQSLNLVGHVLNTIPPEIGTLFYA